MKDIHLSYAPLGGAYFLDYTKRPIGTNRDVFAIEKGFKGLLKKLDESISPKRKSILRLHSIPEEVIEEIKKRYQDTKVQIQIEKFQQ